MQAMHLEAVDLRREQMRAVRRKLLQLEKTVVRQRHREGAVSEASMRTLLNELDYQIHTLDEAIDVAPQLEETGLTGVQTDLQGTLDADTR